MWLIMSGENHEGGSVRRTLPATATDAEVIEALRTLAKAMDYSSGEWLRADLWEVNATEPLRWLWAEDVGIKPRDFDHI